MVVQRIQLKLIYFQFKLQIFNPFLTLKQSEFEVAHQIVKPLPKYFMLINRNSALFGVTKNLKKLLFH